MPTSFSHIDLCLVTLPLPLLQLLQNCYCYFYHRYRYFHTTLLLNILLQIWSLTGVVELTNQLLILENILWLPLCRISRFGLNTLPSKTVAIPYTCGLSPATRPALCPDPLPPWSCHLPPPSRGTRHVPPMTPKKADMIVLRHCQHTVECRTLRQKKNMMSVVWHETGMPLCPLLTLEAPNQCIYPSILTKKLYELMKKIYKPLTQAICFESISNKMQFSTFSTVPSSSLLSQNLLARVLSEPVIDDGMVGW